MYCSRDYYYSSRFNQQYEKPTPIAFKFYICNLQLNCFSWFIKCVISFHTYTLKFLALFSFRYVHLAYLVRGTVQIALCMLAVYNLNFHTTQPLCNITNPHTEAHNFLDYLFQCMPHKHVTKRVGHYDLFLLYIDLLLMLDKQYHDSEISESRLGNIKIIRRLS